MEQNRQRLHFFLGHLEHQPRDEAELEGILSKYLPNVNPDNRAPSEKVAGDGE